MYQETAAIKTVVNLSQLSLGESSPVSVISVTTVPHLPGRIYCEAQSYADVMKILSLTPAHLIKKKPVSIPLGDRTAVLTLPPEITLTKGTWMRVKRGIYANDLACFDTMDQDKVVAWVVPRIALDKDSARVKGKHIQQRPPMVPFDAKQVAVLFGAAAVKQKKQQPAGTVIFRGHTFRDGLLMLLKPPTYFDTNVIEPSADNLHHFVPASAWLKPHTARLLNHSWHSTALSTVQTASVVNRNRDLSIGQRVVVLGDQLHGLVGQIVSIGTSTAVVIEPIQNVTCTVSLENLRCYFGIGDHIKVRTGVHEGQWGMVVAIHESTSHLTFVDSVSRTHVSLSYRFWTTMPTPLIDRNLKRRCRCLSS